MAEEGGGGAGTSKAGMFLFLILAGATFLWVSGSASQGGLFGSNASSTRATSTTLRGTQIIDATISNDLTSDDTIIQTAPPRPATRQEIESDLANAYDKVDDLKVDLETAKIWGVHSPYERKVWLQSGNLWSGDPDTEYLVLYADGQNTEAINITGWRLVSYVTNESAVIPGGSRLLYSGQLNAQGPIMLEPGENAYVTTGDSPKGASFHENMCTGYFTEHQEFTPAVPRSCPYPLEEMKRYGDIELDDDSCYDFVSQVSSCITPDHSSIAEADLSPECERFVENDLTYSGCVRNHQGDPYFSRGAWHIFLGEWSELWRGEREIIKLLDAQGQTVSVLKY